MLGAVLLILFAVVTAEKVGAQIKTPSAGDLLSFRWGETLGCCPNGMDDAKLTTLTARAGCSTQRKKLPEAHFDRWGYGIELEDAQHGFDLGQRDLVGYLCTPSTAHSSVPSDAENNPPLNLYAPIWTSEGKVNPDNYWAAYVNKTVSMYHTFVRVWEVWNEPDWTSNHAAVSSWLTSPPNPNDLAHWKGSIFAYNRILRITYEVAKRIDPNSWVAVGGLGYTTFLDAILRYTDEPNNGAVAVGYESTGGAYFDCLSYHCYPMYGVTDDETGVSIAGTGSDTLAQRFVTLKKNFQKTLSKYGYANGGAYPAKMFIATETGVASQSINGFVGSEILRRNYIAKLPLLSIPAGIKQAHWFMLYDSGGSSPFGWMGDYESLSAATVDTAAMKASTHARLAFRKLGIDSMVYSRTLTESLLNALPANITGVVLGNNTKQLWALWHVSMDSTREFEEVTAHVTVPDIKLQFFDWNATLLTPVVSGNSVTLALSSSPSYLLIDGGVIDGDSDDATSTAFAIKPSIITFLLLFFAIAIAGKQF